MSELEFLNSRLEEIEYVTNNLLFSLQNEDDTMYGNPLMFNHLTGLLFQGAAIRRKLVELKHD